MSRVGQNPVVVPDGVTVTIANDVVTVEGPKGTLTQRIAEEVTVDVSPAPAADGETSAGTSSSTIVTVGRTGDSRVHRSLHGLTRALVDNMCVGVSEGYSKELEIVGVGYRAESNQPTKIKLALGFSHPVEVDAPEGISFDVPDQTTIRVTGHDKQLVGQVAANIRALRKPEPYKGKGIRYAGERVIRKAGKAAK